MSNRPHHCKPFRCRIGQSQFGESAFVDAVVDRVAAL